MNEDLQKRAMAVDYAVKLSAQIGMMEMDGDTNNTPQTFMTFVEAIYNFLNGETK